MIAPDEIDPYYKLRPEPPTPEDEICQCADLPPIVLQDHLSSVPLVCLHCNGEVPPERVGFDADLAERIAYLAGSAPSALHAVDRVRRLRGIGLRTQLSDPQGQFNTRGLEVVGATSIGIGGPYYWWFDDASDRDVSRLACPRCYGDLVDRFGCAVCEVCSIVVHRGRLKSRGQRETVRR